MSDKLTALPVVTTLADADLIYVVDVSDTTDDPAGSSAAITKANLATAVGGGGGGSQTLIEEIEVTVAGDITFSSIPQTYDRLYIRGYLRSTIAATIDSLLWEANGDTVTANYDSCLNYQNGPTNTTWVVDACPGLVAGSTSPANMFGQLHMVIEDYASTTRTKTLLSEGTLRYDATYATRQHGATIWNSTAAITSLRFDSAAANLAVGTKLQLIGETVTADGGGGGGGSVSILSRVALETITLATAGEFDFSAISGDYDTLYIEGYVQAERTDFDALHIYFNADTTDANYHHQHMFGNNSFADSGEAANPQLGLIGGSLRVDRKNFISVKVPYYTDTAMDKTAMCRLGGPTNLDDAMWQGDSTVISSVTAAITRIRLQSDNDPTEQLTGELTLYGEKIQSVGSGGGGSGVEMMTEIEIQAITDPGAGGYVFTVPAGYEELEIRGHIQTPRAGTWDTALIAFNADATAANYHSTRGYAQATTQSAQSDSTNRLGNIAGTSAIAPGYLTVTIPDPDGSNIKSAGSSSELYEVAGSTVSRWDSTTWHDTLTAALTTVTISAEFATAVGTLTLYGKKKQSVGGGGGPVLIEEIELAAGGEFDFASIPSQYTRLKIVGKIRSTASVVTDTPLLIMNTETTQANYKTQSVHAWSTSPGSGWNAGASTMGFCAGATQTAGVHGDINITVEQYASAAYGTKTATFEYASLVATGNIQYGTGVVYCTTITTAINRLRIRTDNDPTDQLTGVLRLYGEM